MANNEVVGVLDIDSDQLNTFDETDRRYLEELVSVLSKTLYGND
jgi:GAF domain-containing protein